MYGTSFRANYLRSPYNTVQMRNSLLLAAALLASVSIQAQELPVPSPRSTVTQRVGLTDVTIDYSRPSAKERTIYGELVPYGKMWRTGANKNTTIELSSDAMVGGEKVSAGTYSIFTIPSEDSWEVILNSKTDHYGTDEHQRAEAEEGHVLVSIHYSNSNLCRLIAAPQAMTARPVWKRGSLNQALV